MNHLEKLAKKLDRMVQADEGAEDATEKVSHTADAEEPDEFEGC